jgi:hypothetical protein
MSVIPFCFIFCFKKLLITGSVIYQIVTTVSTELMETRMLLPLSIEEWEGYSELHFGKECMIIDISHCRLFQPSYRIPQQPIKPQVVRPSAQYPAGVGPCRPAPTYLQTVTAVNSSQGLLPGIAQYSNSLIASQSR